MKTFNKFLFFALVAIGLTTQSCKDNILTPVNNTKTADSLVALINTLNSKLVTVNAKDNSLKIQLAKFQSNADSLKALAQSNSSYSQSVQYTVYLVDGGNSATGTNYYGDRICKDCKVAGVDGATVTVNSNGQTYTKVSADGRAVFSNLNIAGLATVTIAANGYTGCSYTTYFSPSYYGGVGTLSPYSSNFSGYSTTNNNVPSSTNGSGSGATFNVTVGNSGNITSIGVSSPGSGYKVGDQITIYGYDICECGGSLTYTVTSLSHTNNDSGVSINASTNVLILPTVGKNATTYTGQLYINRTSMDDTLGRQYLKVNDPLYKKFISPNGPYHGKNYTEINFGTNGLDYSQNQYFNGSTNAPTAGNISFTPLIGTNSLTGLNYIYGYPTNVGNYYNPINGNYQFLPGDILSITYNSLISFATIDNTGKYTLVVPSYQNNPGTTIGATEGWGGSGGSRIHFQDNYTYLSSNPSPGSTNPTLKEYHNDTYAITTNNSYYQTTKKVDYLPYVELDSFRNGDYYGYIGGSSSYNQQFNSSPGQTVTRNIFFFAAYLSQP